MEGGGEVTPVSHWKGDLVNDEDRHLIYRYERQQLFWLWGGQVSKMFMMDRYSLSYVQLNKFIKQHGKQTAKVLERRLKARKKQKRVKLCLEWLSERYGLSYAKLYQRYYIGDRGQSLIRGNRERVAV